MAHDSDSEGSDAQTRQIPFPAHATLAVPSFMENVCKVQHYRSHGFLSGQPHFKHATECLAHLVHTTCGRIRVSTWYLSHPYPSLSMKKHAPMIDPGRYLGYLTRAWGSADAQVRYIDTVMRTRVRALVPILQDLLSSPLCSRYEISSSQLHYMVPISEFYSCQDAGH